MSDTEYSDSERPEVIVQKDASSAINPNAEQWKQYVDRLLQEREENRTALVYHLGLVKESAESSSI